MAAPTNPTILRRAFVDVYRGYSTTVYAGRPVYIRHLSHIDHVAYDEVQKRYEDIARAAGAVSEAERMAELKQSGRWSDQKERGIERQRDGIARFEDTIAACPRPSEVASLVQQVSIEKTKLNDLIAERTGLLGMTIEAYALRMLNDHYVVTNLFMDKALTQPLYGIATFDDLPDSEIESLLEVYHEAILPCNDTHMRQLAVQDWFTPYWAAANDSTHAFYGKPVAELTYYQIRLSSIARHFAAILQGVDLTKVPSAMRADPDALERSYTTQRAIEQQKAEGKLPSGMTQDDIKQTGLEGSYAKVDKQESAIEIAKRLASTHRRG